MAPGALTKLVEARKRSYDMYDTDDNRVFVNKMSRSTWVKETQWHFDNVKTTYVQAQAGWRKIEDRVPIREWADFDEPANLVVVVHHEQLLMPTTKRPAASEAPRVQDSRRRAFNHDQRKKYQDVAAHLCYVDCAMWAQLKPTGAAPLMKGCKTLLLELFCGVLLLSTVASAAGWAVSRPVDLSIDGNNLFGKSQATNRRASRARRSAPFYNPSSRRAYGRPDTVCARVDGQYDEGKHCARTHRSSGSRGRLSPDP